MQRIEHPENYEVSKFDGVDSCTVYMGGISYLENANDKLNWRRDEKSEVMCEVVPFHILTLKEISEQLREKAGIITVFIEEPLHGTILQYGNYGDSWREIGETCGYA